MLTWAPPSTTAPRKPSELSPEQRRGSGRSTESWRMLFVPGPRAQPFGSSRANIQIARMADESNPMGRLGDPELDIAPVAVFLATDDARYLTGKTLFVDGRSH